MRERKFAGFYTMMLGKKMWYPLEGQIELTYRCSLDCVHCYCKGSEDKKKELTTAEFKRIFDEVHGLGCLMLTFTGGDPLIRPDFLELYAYAKQKGFVISVFSSGQLFTDAVIRHFKRSPPNVVEITLNGITKKTYESITQVNGSFEKAIRTIRRLKEEGINLILKTNCLKQNQHEIVRIKAFTERLLGRASQNEYRFKFDPLVLPRLNGDKTPCQHRLSFEELLAVRKQDPEIWQEYKELLCFNGRGLGRNRDYLYHCNSWRRSFFLDPFGTLKFCGFLDAYSVNLRTTPFREGFYKVFPKVARRKFKTRSQCRSCRIRANCYFCPARAYLETGSEEGRADYFCHIARATAAFESRCKKERSRASV